MCSFRIKEIKSDEDNLNSVIVKKSFLRIMHTWFTMNNNNENTDIIILHDISIDDLQKRNKNNIYYINLTAITNLSNSEDELWSVIGKTCRYEIRRAIKENIHVKNYSSKELRNREDILDELENCYNQMYAAKGINQSFNRKLVVEYIKAGIFDISVAEMENQNLVFHSYILGNQEEKVRLLYSCSLFRADGQDRNLIGRANKYLHWEDLRYYKRNGYAEYDWGGISSYDTPNGIDKFKLEFGGGSEKNCRIIAGMSLRGRIVLKILKWFKKI